MAIREATAESHRPTGLRAIVEEAWRRAKRRRLIYATVALAFVACVAAGAAALRGGAGDPQSAATARQDPTLAPHQGYVCPPTQPARAPEPGVGFSVPGCLIRVQSELPAGWNQNRSTTTAFPAGVRGDPLISWIQFSNYAVHLDSSWPPKQLAQGDAAVMMQPEDQLPVSQAGRTRVSGLTEHSFERSWASSPNDYFARAHMFLGGWRFSFLVDAGASKPSSDKVDEINRILASIRVHERLCPCSGNPL